MDNKIYHKRRLPFFPTPAPGETLYSVACRIQARSGLQEKIIINSLTGQKNKPAIMHSVPNYCKRISHRVPNGQKSWNDSRHILLNHTALPYFTYFDGPELRQKWLNEFSAANDVQPLRMALGLMAYRGHATPSHPRYCVSCAREQIQILKSSYFRREHQLPWVSVCETHGTLLSMGCKICGPYPLKHAGMNIPGRCYCDQGASFLPCDDYPPQMLEALKWIAVQSAYMVNSGGTSSTNIRKDLKKCLIEKGLCRGSLLNHEVICSAIEGRFGSGLLKRLGYPVRTRNKPSPWIVKGLTHQKENKRSPALVYLLFIGTLFESVAAFECHIQQRLQIKLHSRSAKNVQKKDTLPTSKVDQITELVKTHHYGARTIAVKLGLKDSEVVNALRNKKIRVPLSRRLQNKLSPETIECICRELENGESKKSILEKFNISEWTLINIELDRPELYETQKRAAEANLIKKHRNIIRRLIEEDPNVTRETVHRDHVATYEHLRKYDLDWFEAKVALKPRQEPSDPRKPRHNWGQIDAQKAIELEQLVAQYTDPNQKPVWVTKTHLLKNLDILNVYLKTKHHFPKVDRLIMQLVESYDTYIERKIRFTIGGYQPDEVIAVNTLRRRAGVPAKVLRRFKSAVVDEAHKCGLTIHSRSCFATQSQSDIPDQKGGTDDTD